MDNKEIKSFELNIKEEGSEKGNVEAVFSVFGNVDSDGDVVVPGAVKSGFKDTQVPMVFAHKWDQPIGKGTIVQDNEKAVFKGSFFMETEAGKEAYNLVKSMGDLQQWSFGFRVDDSEVAPFKKSDEQGDEYDVRYLKELTVYEVSPVLVGANQETYTLAIKSGEDTIYEKTQEKKYGSCNHDEDGSCYKESKKELKSDPEDEGCCQGGNKGSEEVSEKTESSVSGRRFSEEVKDVLIALDDLVERAKAIGSLRSQDGRKLSEKATDALRAVQEDLNEAWNEIDEVIVEVGTLVTQIEEETPDTEKTEEEVAETETVEEASSEEIVEDNLVEETQGDTVVETEDTEEVVEVEVEESEVEEVEEVEASIEEEVVEDEEDEDIDGILLEAQHTVTESLIAETELDEI
mgnify:CR=1 FL=1|tara:strand:- start:2085 stop:3299 length:1215 start_codon:yes stop_codon:yes gene_type:complete